jgi:RecA/RadA recombinase
MATRAKKLEDITVFNPYAHLDIQIDAMEKQFKLNAMSISKDEPRFSTGLLSLDIQLAGGLLGGGWYTCFGGEQSAKSTLAMVLLSSIMAQKGFAGTCAYFDYEGSSQAEYIENIMHSMGVAGNVENVFGLQDEQTGEWIVQPRVRYYTPPTGEMFFNYLAKLEKILPDKVCINGNWFYIFDNTRDNQKALKGRYDPAYFAKHNRFRVPADDGNAQAVILVDSYPAMLPQQTDDKEEGDKSLASQARMFSEGLKRVKSAMRAKRILVFGVNQLRKVPMAMYGPTEQEPGGEALRFFSDVRLRMSSISPPHPVVPKGVIEKEESVRYKGDDSYRYIKIRTYKNKLGGIPNQEITMRLVVENGNGDATGFCHTWDAYQYLKLTGQIAGTRKAIKFLKSIEVAKHNTITQKTETETIEFNNPLAGCKLDWYQFKTLIEGDRDSIREVCSELKLVRPILFMSFLRKQVSIGKGYQYMLAAKRLVSQSKKKAVDEEVSANDDAE